MLIFKTSVIRQDYDILNRFIHLNLNVWNQISIHCTILRWILTTVAYIKVLLSRSSYYFERSIYYPYVISINVWLPKNYRFLHHSRSLSLSFSLSLSLSLTHSITHCTYWPSSWKIVLEYTYFTQIERKNISRSIQKASKYWCENNTIYLYGTLIRSASVYAQIIWNVYLCVCICVICDDVTFNVCKCVCLMSHL